MSKLSLIGCTDRPGVPGSLWTRPAADGAWGFQLLSLFLRPRGVGVPQWSRGLDDAAATAACTAQGWGG